MGVAYSNGKRTHCECVYEGSIPSVTPKVVSNGMVDRYGYGAACKAVTLRSHLGSIPSRPTIFSVDSIRIYV